MALTWIESWDNITTASGSSSESVLSEYLTTNFNRSDWRTGGEPQLHAGRLAAKALSLGSGTNGDLNWIEIPCGSTNEVIVGFSYRPPIYRGANQNDWIEFWNYNNPNTSSAKEQVQIELVDCGVIFRRGTSGRIAEAVGIFNQLRWCHIEIRIIFDDSAGEIQMRVNGDLVINKTGIDTNNGGNDTCDIIRWHGVESPSTNDDEYMGLIDDVYILDGSGPAPANDPIGPNIFIESILPTADGDTIQWTPSSGDNYTNVDDEIAYQGSDYNTSSTTGHVDLFEMEDLTIVSTDILAVEVRSAFISTAPGLVSLIPKVKENGTTGDGDAVPTIDDSAYLDCRYMFTTNPDTGSAWTSTEVDDMQCGYEVG